MTALAATARVSRSRELPLALQWRVVALVLLPFAGGFYLSYLYRSVNALIADHLMAELGIGAAELGLLTSTYLLLTAAAQIPVGIWLDRYGPRRVQAALLLVAAIGAWLFAMAQGFWGLLLGRALIGLGVATALMAGIKAAVMWVPRERLPLANGILLGLGALGAVTATLPAELLIEATSWRTLFLVLAALTLASATAVWLLVPEPATGRTSPVDSTVGVAAIARDPRFWPLAALAGLAIGTSWALQGLWAARWLADVDGLARAHVVTQLLVMALALSAGAFGLGWGADRLSRQGWPVTEVFAVACAVSIAAQLALLARAPLPHSLLWSVIAAMGAGTVLSYAILATYVPKEQSGRANALLNLFHFGTAFAVQSAFGLVVASWPADDGRPPAEGYRTALAIFVVLQSSALLWFLKAVWPARVTRYAASLPVETVPPPNVDYLAARRVWLVYLTDARSQARGWRAAALAALCTTGLLSVVAAGAVLDRAATVHVIEVDHVASLAQVSEHASYGIHATARAPPPSEAATLIASTDAASIEPINPSPPVETQESPNVETRHHPSCCAVSIRRPPRSPTTGSTRRESRIAAWRHKADRNVGPRHTRGRLPVHRGDAGHRSDDEWPRHW